MIGKDGQQYGPVTPEQLRTWITENRANAQTLVQADGTQDWKPLGSLPEFAANLKPPLTAATVPSRSASTPVGSDAPGKSARQKNASTPSRCPPATRSRGQC